MDKALETRSVVAAVKVIMQFSKRCVTAGSSVDRLLYMRSVPKSHSSTQPGRVGGLGSWPRQLARVGVRGPRCSAAASGVLHWFARKSSVHSP